MKVELRADCFDAYAELAAYQQQSLQVGAHGAASCFIGSARDFNDGEPVQDLVLEHYPGMTDRFVERIAEQAMVQWPLLDVLVLHRYGQVTLGDAIVLIGVWSAHRGAAFEACRFIIEELKHEAPFWKQEGVGQSKRWVATNTGS